MEARKSTRDVRVKDRSRRRGSKWRGEDNKMSVCHKTSMRQAYALFYIRLISMEAKTKSGLKSEHMFVSQ